MQFHGLAASLALILFSIISIPTCSYAAAVTGIESRDPPSCLSSVEVVHQFPVGFSAENLVVRKDGKILVTIINRPELYLIDPLQPEAQVLVSDKFTSVVGLLGIVELGPDVFYVVAGNFSATAFTSTPGTYSVWKVDLTNEKPAQISKVADFPDAAFLNGMDVLDRKNGLVVIADSVLGVVWRLNVHTGEVLKIIDDPLMKPTMIPNVPEIGINGLKVRNDALYFTNSDTSNFCRIPIHDDGTSAGEASVMASGLYAIDDFQFDKKGIAFAALNFANELAKVAPIGIQTTVVGNSTVVLRTPTACQFGKNPNILYITSDGNATQGGRLSKVHLKGKGD